MDAEIKAKLEEMADEYARVHFRKNSTELFGNICEDYKAGFQAAWNLAVKAERERIKNVIESAGKYTNGLHNSIFNTILTPEEVKSE